MYVYKWCSASEVCALEMIVYGSFLISCLFVYLQDDDGDAFTTCSWQDLFNGIFCRRFWYQILPFVSCYLNTEERLQLYNLLCLPACLHTYNGVLHLSRTKHRRKKKLNIFRKLSVIMCDYLKDRTILSLLFILGNIKFKKN